LFDFKIIRIMRASSLGVNGLARTATGGRPLEASFKTADFDSVNGHSYPVCRCVELSDLHRIPPKSNAALCLDNGNYQSAEPRNRNERISHTAKKFS